MSPRPRRQAASSRQAFPCPECGRTFGRAAALGAHRKRSHGVAGSSRPGRGAASSRRNGALDHNQLLRTLFPNGLPADVEVIGAVNRWLAEADRLART